MTPRAVGLLAVILPLVALNVSFLLSAANGHVPACIPYLEGCTSISRAARRGDSIFIFRAIMMPYTLLLALLWSYSFHWIRLIEPALSRRAAWCKYIGWIGALALLAYVDFLGTEGSYYRLMRRYGVIVFFGFTGFAQLMLTSCLYRLPKSAPRAALRFRSSMYLVCLAMLALAFVHLWASLIPEGDAYENIVEWNFGLLLIIFGFVTWRAWEKTGFTISYGISKSAA